MSIENAREPLGPNAVTVVAPLEDLLGCLGLSRGWRRLFLAPVASYAKDIARQFVPAPRTIARWIRARDAVPAAGSHFTILVADPEGDTDGSQTRHVIAALGEEPGFRVHLAGRMLGLRYW